MKSKKLSEPTSLKLNSRITNDPAIVSNLFNSFSRSIAEKLEAKLLQTESNFSNYLPQESNKTIFLSKTN